MKSNSSRVGCKKEVVSSRVDKTGGTVDVLLHVGAAGWGEGRSTPSVSDMLAMVGADRLIRLVDLVWLSDGSWWTWELLGTRSLFIYPLERAQNRDNKNYKWGFPIPTRKKKRREDKKLVHHKSSDSTLSQAQIPSQLSKHSTLTPKICPAKIKTRGNRWTTPGLHEQHGQLLMLYQKQRSN